MKKLFTICLILMLFASSAYGTVRGNPKTERADIERKIDGLDGTGRGGSWYVYSGATGGATGVDWTNAVTTIEAAVDKAAAYDTIHVGQAHNGSMDEADEIDLDKAGLYLKGYGRGSAMPTLDYDGVAGELVIGAPNVRVENIRFRISVASGDTANHAIDVEAAAHYAEIVGCKFGFAEAVGTDEWASMIVVNSLNRNSRIEDCLFDAGEAACSQAISFAAVSGIIIVDNDMFGDYATACLQNAAAAQDVHVEDNVLFNGLRDADGVLNAVAAISFANNTAGLVLDNRIVSDVATAALMRVMDDGVFMNNFVSDTDGDEFTGTLEAGKLVNTGTTASTTTISGHVDG